MNRPVIECCGGVKYHIDELLADIINRVYDLIKQHMVETDKFNVSVSSDEDDGCGGINSYDLTCAASTIVFTTNSGKIIILPNLDETALFLFTAERPTRIDILKLSQLVLSNI